MSYHGVHNSSYVLHCCDFQEEQLPGFVLWKFVIREKDEVGVRVFSEVVGVVQHVIKVIRDISTVACEVMVLKEERVGAQNSECGNLMGDRYLVDQIYSIIIVTAKAECIQVIHTCCIKCELCRLIGKLILLIL